MQWARMLVKESLYGSAEATLPYLCGTPLFNFDLQRKHLRIYVGHPHLILNCRENTFLFMRDTLFNFGVRPYLYHASLQEHLHVS